MRILQRELVNQLATELLSGKIHRDSAIDVDAAGGKIVLSDSVNPEKQA